MEQEENSATSDSEKTKTPIYEVNLRQKSQTERDWCMNISNLLSSATIDYFTFRQLLLLNLPYYFTQFKLLRTAADCFERLMKAFVLSYDHNFKPRSTGHRLEDIRLECLKFDNYFNNQELTEFCKQYTQNIRDADKKNLDLHQIYAYHDMFSIASGITDLTRILNILDEVFLETSIRMRHWQYIPPVPPPSGWSYNFVNYEIVDIYMKHIIASIKYKYPVDNFDMVWNTYFTNNIAIATFCSRYEKKIASHYDSMDIRMV